MLSLCIFAGDSQGEVAFHCRFNLRFTQMEWDWASFYPLPSHSHLPPVDHLLIFSPLAPPPRIYFSLSSHFFFHISVWEPLHTSVFSSSFPVSLSSLLSLSSLQVSPSSDITSSKLLVCSLPSHLRCLSNAAFSSTSPTVPSLFLFVSYFPWHLSSSNCSLLSSFQSLFPVILTPASF